MNAAVSLKLLNITQQFIADKQKATEFVQLLEETIEDKFDNESGVLATKEDLVREIGNVRVEIKETKADIRKQSGKPVKGLLIAARKKEA